MVSKNWKGNVGDLGAPFGGVGRASPRHEGGVWLWCFARLGWFWFVSALRVVTVRSSRQLSEQRFGAHTFNFVLRSDSRFFRDCQARFLSRVTVSARGLCWLLECTGLSPVVRCSFPRECRPAVRCTKCAGPHDILSRG